VYDISMKQAELLYSSYAFFAYLFSIAASCYHS